MRLALAHPDRVKAFIIQNAVASEDGLGPAWDVRKAFWRDRAANEQKVIPNFLSFAVTKGRHLGSSPNVDRYDPNEWIDEFAHLSSQVMQIQRPFYDYDQRAAYPPARLHAVVSGAYDRLSVAAAYQKDVHAGDSCGTRADEGEITALMGFWARARQSNHPPSSGLASARSASRVRHGTIRARQTSRGFVRTLNPPVLSDSRLCQAMDPAYASRNPSVISRTPAGK